MGRIFFILTFTGAGLASPIKIGTEDLFRLIRESTAIDLSDDEIARELLQSELTQQLSSDSTGVIKDLGVGPATLSALDALRARSAALPVPPVPVASATPIPEPAQFRDLLNNLSVYASGYVRALPNFLCQQTTSFYKAARIASRGKPGWKLEETVVEDLRYHDGSEDYQTRLIDGKPSSAPVAEIRSNYTRGEFGSILSDTFDPSSQTDLQWDHWETISGKRLAVIRYRVEQAHSRYRICCVVLGSVTVNGIRRERTKSLLVAYRGYIYADPATGTIELLTLQNIGIPPELRLDDARLLLQYQPRMLNGKETWLPAKAIHYSRQSASGIRSDIEFSSFRSFGANSVIQFPTESEPQP